jgi:hypothetical protein
MSTRPSHAGHGLAAIVVLTLTAAGAAACGGSSPPGRSSVPAVFRPACGHPGAAVTVTKLPVTIPHAVCDLTGVTITVPGRGGMVVPDSSGGAGNSEGLTLTVDDGSLDIHLTAKGPPGTS